MLTHLHRFNQTLLLAVCMLMLGCVFMQKAEHYASSSGLVLKLNRYTDDVKTDQNRMKCFGFGELPGFSFPL